jgi:hypothetical protein
MTFIDEPSVTVVEVGKRVGQTMDDVKAEAAELGLFIGPNWTHEAALSTRDAFSLVDGSARRNHGHDRAWSYHQAALLRRFGSVRR